MKKMTNFLLLALLATASIVGCNPKPEEVPVEKPEIAISAEGLSVKMEGKDIERTFTVTATAAAEKDIIIIVSTPAAITDAIILTPAVTILKGETTTTGKIKFLGSAFPIGAAAKDIKVSIESDDNATIADGKKEIKYTVIGSDKPIELPNATFTCEITEIIIAGEDVSVPVKIKLDRPAEQYTEFSVVYAAENTITAGAFTSMYPYAFIDEGSSEVDFFIEFDGKVFVKGVEGVSHLALKSDGAIVDNNSTVKISVKGVDPNKATLSVGAADVVVGDADLSKTITVTLTEAALSDVIFNLVVEGKAGDFEIVNKTITIKKGEKAGTGVIKFLKKAFPIELMTGTAIVSITTSASGIIVNEPNKVLLNIKGTGTAPMGTITTTESKTVKVGSTDKTIEFAVNVSEAISKIAKFTITATSDKNDSYTLNNATLSVAAGSLTAKGSITFKAASFPYDTDKANIKISITSDDVIVINSGSTLDLKVLGETLNPNKEDVRYHFEGNTKKTVYLGNTKSTLALFVINEGRTRPNKKNNNVYAEVTGGIEGIDYEFIDTMPILITPTANPYTYLDLNVLPAAAGKKLIIELFCDEATIGTNSTMELDIVYIEWFPITRSAPRAAINNDGGNYAVIVPSVKIGDITHTHTYPVKEWNDLYATKSFDVKKGDNTIELSMYSVSDPYYLERTYMVIYADFNNDGDFSDTGEMVALSKVAGLEVKNSKQFTATMKVPNDAAAEFAVRIGAIVPGLEIGKAFKEGYFIDPGDASTVRLSDFKAIVK